MIDVVVAYDRSSATAIEQRLFTDDSQAAFAVRLELEREYRKRRDVEVVLLSANSFDDLKISHARYFDPTSIRANSLKDASERLLDRAS